MAAILSLAGSNSSTSINYQLVQYTTSLIEGHEIRLLNMARYPFPMYSQDEENQKGYSNSLVELKDDIQNADAIILSVNEHNSNPSAYFKNVIDWLSRLERKFLLNKKILLMSTSAGKRGGAGSLEVTQNMLPRFGAEIVSTFSLPSFHENFSSNEITDDRLKIEHKKALNTFLETLK
ncbi:NADPH-dependent FMN reductase [Flagellimonas aquimarina]|jgi:chromate reductase|uniref:NADPH-dependent FMN reductase n=1 Tax=Flagellimonas aquimarina TaxID=2201895 RepID=A0A316KYN7_9FLAO|nr:NAD(P)H-dependent oxidoreductase [Allomuricauda koreensis]PWL38736.1 NADPH-dependent FMN reductase [Allomuricauda koreensis]